MDEIQFESLSYGAYVLDPDLQWLQENVRYATADFNTLHVRQVRLPDGRGNIIYLLGKTFESCVQMIQSRYFIIPPNYLKLYFPPVVLDRFMKRRIRVNAGPLRIQRTKALGQNTKLRIIPQRTLQKTMDNLFFVTSDIYQEAEVIMRRYPVRQNYMKFFSEFHRILQSLTPPIVKEGKDASWNNRVLILDADSFHFNQSAKLKDNQTNPLFLFYLAFLRTKDLAKLETDLDMMICSRNMFLKFNPAKTTRGDWAAFRRALFRIMDANLDDYVDALEDSEKKDLELRSGDVAVSKIVQDATEPFTHNVSGSTKIIVQDAVEKKLKKQAAEALRVHDEIKAAMDTPQEPTDVFQKSLQSVQPVSIVHPPKPGVLDKERERLFKAVASGHEPLSSLTGQIIDDDDDDDEFDRQASGRDLEDFEDDVREDATDILTNDPEVAEEVLDEIQDKTVPLHDIRTAPVNSARDKKLREEQKKVVVRNSSIEEILARDASNVPIQSSDKSQVMHTSNPNMQKITFSNFDKTYLDELYTKDILSCFDSLKDKGSPFYITGIDITDTSDSMNLKETWAVHLKDENNKRHTIRVDIPKFLDDRFMIIKGKKWIILKQNMYNPLVKDTPDTVILTTNYNKITIERKATKSLSYVERVFSLAKKSGNSNVFVSGDSTRGNAKYCSTLEYDEYARRIFKFETDNCEIWFSRDYIAQNVLGRINPKSIEGNEFFIGHVGNESILINEDTGLDRHGRTITQIIEENLPEDLKADYEKIKSPKQLMYVHGKMAGQWIPIATVLIVWVGISEMLRRMKVQWNFDPKAKRVPANTAGKRYIRFADGVLEYDATITSELVLNGLSKMHPEQYRFEDFESEVAISDFLYAQWGNYKGISQIRLFYEFLVDPITKDVCRDMSLPDDAIGLMLHAVQLLNDNVHVSKASDQSYRVRSIEMIPAMLYKAISRQYATYVSSGRRIPMTLNQNCIIQQLILEKTVEAYSTLNPVIEVSKTHSISPKGFNGSNSQHSYDEAKRSYDPTSVGKIAISTSADANVGVQRNLVVEPQIINARGYRDRTTGTEDLKDVNVFSPVEMLTPGTARNDDPIRTAIACKQSSHVVPVEDAAPGLISNGYDEAIQFSLSSDFVINAEEDGKVISVDEETGFIMVQYKSGKTRAISTEVDVVHNSGGGFYMSNQLTPVYTKVGQTFKKDMPLAYHPKYFKYSPINGLRYAIGPIAKVAFMSSYNTYEDAGIVTEVFGERMKTSIVYQENGKFKRNNNILSMVKVGDHVDVGDVLIRFDTAVDDDELAKYLTKLSAENAEILETESKSDLKSSHAGTVIDIKIYTLEDPSNLSPSLCKIVQDYWGQAEKKKQYLEKFDGSDGFVKAGYMLMDSCEPVKSQYHEIKGFKGIDVLIEIYIEHADVMGVGDKHALYAANKQIVSEVIPKGYEPYSELHPDEEISVIFPPGTASRRMTPSAFAISAGTKCLIELKRQIKDKIKYK